uniref:DUF4004 family protein n=1 Tax=uncultured organism TaxID=155900 RepID=M1P0E4_9ZZZZ|nr:hypothetical protein FLSS-1_0014 [uncultured organism]
MNEENLLPKKEVLKKGDISYGQFYRWKRKGLIPEDWIIHKSTYTGQESFLPGRKILKRIERIKDLKENHTLDEIAKLLSPELADKEYDRAELLDIDWVEGKELDKYQDFAGKSGSFGFEDLVNLALFVELKEKGISSGVQKLALSALSNLEDSSEGKLKDQRVYVLESSDESGEVYHCLVSDCKPIFDRRTEIRTEVVLGDLIREVKMTLKRKGGSNEN